MTVSRERCQRCKRENPLGFSVPDELWADAVAPFYRDSVLCIFCFDWMATARGVDWSAWPIEWWPVSGVAAGVRPAGRAQSRDAPDYGPIVTAYENGLPARAISASSGLSLGQVYRILKRLGVPRRRRGAPERGAKSTEREQEMVALYESGKSLHEVGLAFGITRERVRQILNKRGNGTRGRAATVEASREQGRIRASVTDAKVRAAHSMGLHLAAIQQATGLSETTVRRSLDRQGLRPQPAPSQINTKINKALQLFDQGLSAAQIIAESGFENENSLRASLHRKGRRFTDRATRAAAHSTTRATHSGGAG